MTLHGGVQLLVVTVAKRPKISLGGIADGGSVCGVGRGRVVHRAGPQSSGSLQVFPDVDVGEVVVAKRRLGVVVYDVEGLHGVAQFP
jgi:hypothetical protein